MTDSDLIAAIVEAGARAMEPRVFATFARGYTARNAIEEAAFLNAEKVVKRARRKSRACLAAALRKLHEILAEDDCAAAVSTDSLAELFEQPTEAGGKG